MRALCGAIITAGALIGLGLISMGIGTRYQGYPYRDLQGEPQWVYLKHLDTALLIALVIALITLVIGLGIAFLGLAYHHHRRHLEMHRTVPPAPGTHSPSERITV
jgi:ABC-type spermidine/putrescine transport system permease subunit I